MKNEIDRFLSGLLDEGMIFQKEVKKCTPTSGAIYLPKELIGKKYTVILAPQHSVVERYEQRINDLEENIKVVTRMIEIVSGKKIRTILEANKEEVEKIRQTVQGAKEEEVEIATPNYSEVETQFVPEGQELEPQPTELQSVKITPEEKTIKIDLEEKE